jgi:hypothetical protein
MNKCASIDVILIREENIISIGFFLKINKNKTPTMIRENMK